MQQPRIASNGGPPETVAARLSSLPRPTVNTSMSASEREYLESPPSSTPDHVHYFEQRQQPSAQAYSSPLSSTTPTAARSFDPNAFRSVSGPSLNSQRSSPIITTAERMRKSSFKDLVARFNQGNENEASSPQSAWKPTGPGAPSSASAPSFPRSAKDPPRQAPIFPTTRQPQSATRSPVVGRGEFPGPFTYLSHDQQQGSASARPATAGSGHASTTSPVRRQPLFGELVPNAPSDSGNIGYDIPQPRMRSGSEGSMHYPNAMFPQSRDSYVIEESPIANETPADLSRSMAVPSTPTHGRSHSDVTVTRSPISRIPVRSPRLEYTTDLTAAGASNPQSPASPSAQTGAAEYISNSNKRLNAIISAPPVKESPALRSSRPRQDINAARAGSPSKRPTDPKSPDKPKTVAALSNMDLASRRESIRKALRDKGWPTDQLAPSTVPGMGENRVPTTDANGQALPQLSSATYTRPTPPLKLNVTNVQPAPSDEPVSGTTQFEEDDSPVLGSGRRKSSIEYNQLDMSKQSNTRRLSYVPDRKPVSSAASDQPTSRTVFSQVMDLRRRDTRRSTQLTTSSTSPLDQDDAGTIQIMLSDTPIISGPDDGAWHSRTPQSTAGHDRDASSNNGSVGLATPDPTERSPSQWAATPGSSMTYDSLNFRRDRDPYSWISRILDQYRESGVVSPEMVHDFQQHIIATDPDLSTSDDIDSMTLAKAALEDIIKDHANSIPNRSNNSRATFVPTGDGSEDPFWQGLGSNVTVVVGGGQQQHLVSPDSATPSSPQMPRQQAGNVFDENGPTPPPKDQTYNFYPLTHQPELLAADALGAEQSNSRPVLPDMPSTDGNLGLALPPEGNNSDRPTSVESNSYPHANDSENKQNPPTSHQHFSTDVDRLSIPRQDASASASQPSDATESGVQSFDGQSASLQAPSADKDVSEANSTHSGLSDHRRLNQRRHTLKELVDTEYSFNRDMKVIEHIYKQTATSVSALTQNDIRILFGNSAQIVDFSESFLDSLKQAARSVYVMPRSSKYSVTRSSPSESTTDVQTESSSLTGNDQTDEERDRKTSIGEAFLTNIARMEKVYGDYLKNHDLANQRLQKLQTVPDVRLWLNECHAYASDITTAWDLDSLLVKPVQRILKYPLLLKNLLESTTEDHPDYENLGLAAKQSEEVSHRINESKKRAELLDQVANKNSVKRKEFDPLKVFARRTDKIAHRVGLSEAVEDAEYKRLAEKFGGRYFQLQIVMRDIEMYKKAAEEFMKQFNRYSEAIEELVDVGHSNSPEIESKWRKFAMTIREMTAIAYADHEAAIKRSCIDPILTLIRLHEGPQKLMQKRKKRIVEYAKYVTMKNRGEKIDKKTQEQGDQFIALNDTLKDELPKLFNLTAKLVEACLKNYVDLQVQWHMTWQRKIKHVLEEQNIASSWDDIVEAFNSDFSYWEPHVLSLGICNRSLLAETSNFMSLTSSVMTDDGSSTKRPSLALQKTSPSIPPNEFGRQSGGSLGTSSFTTPRSSSDSQALSAQQANGYSQHNSRYRADSNLSTQSTVGRNNLTQSDPRAPTYIPASYAPYQGPRQQYRTNDNHLYNPNVAVPQQNMQSYSGAFSNLQQPQASNQEMNRPMSSSTFYSATTSAPGHHGEPQGTSSQAQSSSGVFSSAMPLSDSPENTRPTTPYTTGGQREYKVLFMAASLFEFTIDVTRKEAGYPFLTYGPGEVFNVIAEKGELWLAKNLDDPNDTIGWIWEKHFAKIMSD